MADEKLIFEIGFDLDGAVQVAIKDGKKAITKIQKELGETPIQLDVDTKSLRAELKKLNDEWNKLSASQRAGVEGTKLREQYRALTLEANGYTSTLRSAVSAENKATAAKQRATKATERQTNAYKTQGGYLQRLVQRMIAYASIAQAFSFVRNIRDVTAEFELQRVALGSIIGDLNEANKMFEQIKAAAVKSPFQIKELVSYTKQLAAYKIEQDELFETTQRLADISAGLGVGMERLVLAYGQIRATGYLRASEVRQLTEAGIPIIEELAKKMSQLRGETVSAAKVMGLISERAISFGMVKEVFDDMTSAGGMFYKMQEKQAETLAGQWSNLKDAISIMYDEIGRTEGVNNVMKDMIGLVKTLAENWRELSTVIGSTLGTFIAMRLVNKFLPDMSNYAIRSATATRNYNRAIIEMRTAIKSGDKALISSAKSHLRYQILMRNAEKSTSVFTRSLKKLWAVLVSNPWTAILTALAALGSVLYSAYENATRLDKELAKIGAEGAIQADQSVRNFERLARAIRDSADGSTKQTEALNEMKRAYGDFLPSQDKSIINLVREKDGYNAITQAIREKIAMQIQEQKMNAVASEYGETLGKWEGKVRKVFGKLITPEDANVIIEGIKDAINKGLISSAKEESDNITEISKIIKNITGIERAVGEISDQSGVLPTLSAFRNLIKTQEEYNASIKDIETSMESATGYVGKYTQAYNDLQKSIKDVVGEGEKYSFEWNESVTEKKIEKYHEFIKNNLPEGVTFDIGESIDFKNLYKALGDKYPQFKQVVAKIQGEYEKLVPKDLEKHIKEQFKSIAESAGVSLNEIDEYFKKNDESTQDWVKRLKDASTDIGNKIFDAKKLGKDTKELEAQQKVIDKIADSWDNSKNAQKSAEQALKDELATVEKIYKRYAELRKLKSESETQSILAEEFKGVSLKTLTKAYSPEQMLEVYQKALEEAQRLGKKDLVWEIQAKMGDFNLSETQRNLEKQLSKLSQDLSRTKAAREFFDRMLGLTGDKQLSASLTVSIYGGEMGDDLGDSLARDMATKFQQQVQTYFGDIDISSAIDNATGNINPIKLEKLLTNENIKKIGEDNVIEIRKIINDLIKANADYADELFKSYEKFFDYEKRMTMVTQREEEERKKIRESMIPDAQKAQLEEASKKREQEQISAIEIEQLKDTADWENTFENLNNLGSLTIKNLISLLEEYIAKKREAGEPIAESDLKTLMNELNQLRERDARLDPFATIKTSLKDLTDATREYNKAKREGNKDAMAKEENKRAKALNKLKTAVNAVASGFTSLSNLLTEFQELLGIEDDSAMGEVFNGTAKALGFVATALTAAIALTILWNSTLWANPLFAGVSIVSGVLGAIAGVFSAITNAKVRRANKEIERQKELLEELEYAYERLEKAQDKALGSDYISNYEKRLKNLQAQQKAYLKQAEAERSKGKKADKDKIKEYENSARDTADSIKDMQSELQEYFLGTDLTSAARDFAEAWIEAYKEFGNTTDAMGEKFRDMVQNMVVESLAGKIMQQLLKPVFDAVDSYSKDGNLDEREIASISNLASGSINSINSAMVELMDRLRASGLNIRNTSSQLTGISRDIASASEESILGLAAGINTQNFYISQVPPKLDTIIALLQGGTSVVGGGVNMQDLITIQNQHLAYLPNIAQNTAETVARCERAANACERIADNLDRVIKPRGTQSTHVVNTNV